MKNRKLLLFLIGTFTLSACQPLSLLYMGMKYPKVLNEKELQRRGRKLDIPQSNYFYADEQYSKAIRSKDTSFIKIKNHHQPLQAIYFGKSSYPERWFINCYAYPTSRGVIWNHDGEFNSFPPKGNIKPDSVLNVELFTASIKPLFPENKVSLDSSCYTIVVFESRFYNWLSKNLIKEVKRNVELSKEKTQILYVNTDNYIVPQIFKNYSDDEKQGKSLKN